MYSDWMSWSLCVSSTEGYLPASRPDAFANSSTVLNMEAWIMEYWDHFYKWLKRDSDRAVVKAF